MGGWGTTTLWARLQTSGGGVPAQSAKPGGVFNIADRQGGGAKSEPPGGEKS